MRKVILVAALAVFILNIGKCEEKQYYRHEFSLGIGGGISSIQYKPAVGSHHPGYGGKIGLNYTYFFRPNWGVTTGAEIALLRAKTDIDDLSDNYKTIDDENVPFTLMADISHFEEKQQAYYLNIPFMLQYQENSKNSFCVALGAKLGIPVSSGYKSSGDYLTKGKYDFTRDVFEDMPEHGFGSYTGSKANQKLKLNLNYQLSAEIGYKWHLKENKRLFTGFYCDYGLNDIRKNKSSSLNLFQYNATNPMEYTTNSITQSHYTMNNINENYSGKLNTFAIGIKLMLIFQSGRHVIAKTK